MVLSLFTDNSRTSTKLDMQPLKRYSSNYKLSEGEMHIDAVLRKKFPKADTIKVTDISGGCGDMYEIRIYSEEFEGVRVVQQHKLVTNALKEEVGKMHGLRIFTSTPE
ncbi:unnamed protein product [Clavelina lepadiformis]|uniref:BolA-like protein 3 n=1 Tax=Clavelina lepadiformis TaxID=159417 RepID=A0ABP0FXY0_CLALP